MPLLFHDPDLFDKYFIGSPSIGFNEGITFEYESNYAENHKDLNAEVFMSVGEKETTYTKDLKAMAERLNSHNYESLELTTVIFENESHYTCYPAAMSRGLVDLFSNSEGE